MKITDIAYTGTFPVGQTGKFDKMYLHGELEPGDDVRKCFYALKKQASDFFYESNKAAEKAVVPVIKINDKEADQKNNSEWEEIKEKLSKIKFKEEAQEYLNTTKYSMLVEAKQIINLKKPKYANEKK